MAGIVERVLGAATIDEIDTEIKRLESEIETVRNQIDALGVIRKALVLQRDGKPERKPRGPGKPKPSGESSAPVKPSPSTPFVVVQGETTADTVARYLEQHPGSTCGQVSHATRLPYQNVYAALKAVRFERVGQDGYRVRGGQS